ncbi:uncharacterized protein [Physcomitrium patens]|uniref:ACT domain-containing protein n=2 Tax=Physcomitrium patens TaxID=3218 RepID=A0A2K1JPS9_PHYPA|nr:uncharacterized protein LOC112289743 isoform X2 [Physcomitrium patens]PNR43543.1 hypothetical protein PHYPA_015924 [Physcomitrium patens]|eukprot:XP_024391015.1 uncharacterized protein LOC112289743 isoform X2 [Physcomitrella patens]
MRDSHTSEMRWYSEISTAAFCESLDLRRTLLLKRQSFVRGKQRLPLLEPASAEFISALAAGKNSRHTLQVGCGLSTLALAAAARATNSCLLSVHHEAEKQDVVRYFLKEMELSDYVRFITEDPLTFIPRREGLEFVLLSGQPERYIEIFDVLKLKKGAIVVADNALDDATNDYIRHVRRQPGVDSSTLPLSRGIEVTKIVTWKIFNRGRKKFEGIEELLADKDSTRRPGVVPGLCSSSRLSARSGDASSRFSDFDAEDDLDQSKAASSIGSPTHSDRHYKSGYATSIADSEDKLLQHEVIEQQFKSIQSLAEQWRIQLASLGESSGNSLSSAEESRRKLPDEEPLALFNSHEQAIESPSREASGDLEPGSPQKMDLENNDTSLPSSEASMAERVAPEPLESDEAVFSTEEVVSDYEQPAFKVFFQIDNGQTEVTVEGVDQEMLLFDLTQAFYETGVSVKRAKIATQDTCIVDIFYVVDGVTKAPLSESREEEVKMRILERLSERHQELAN